jgi:hypothetical protein
LVTERARLQRAGVPRSSYHAARRRAYFEGWLRDRYIPNPVTYGLPFAGITVARPFAEQVVAYLRESTEARGTVFVAGSPQLTLKIGWYPTEAEAASAAGSAEAGRFASWSFPIVADLRRPSVPVYFDFEGAFGHLAEISGTEGYPQGLGGSGTTAPPSDTELLNRRRSWGARALLQRPFPDPGEPRDPHRVGPVGVPWGMQKILNQGWITHRVLLEPAHLPSYQGRSATQTVIVIGTLRDGARPEELFSTLTRNCRVYPFLFVAADQRVLIGALGDGPGSVPRTDVSRERSSVLGTLQDRVEGIEILQTSADQFLIRLDHRYDRILDVETP